MVCRADEGVPMRMMKMSRWAARAAFVLPFTLACWASAQSYSITDLGSGTAIGVNTTGQATGNASLNPHTLYDAFLYANGFEQDLGTLGGNTSTGWGVK